MSTAHQRLANEAKAIRFACGNRVSHKDFGLGFVTAIGHTINARPKYVVKFESGRLQTFFDSEIESAPTSKEGV